MQIDISVSAVAWYGAVVATVSAIAGIYAIRRDRPKLKVRVRSKVSIGELIESGVEPSVACQIGEACIIEATNVGRRRIRLQSNPEYKYKDQKRKCDYAWRPKSDLAEGEKAVIIMGKNADLSQLTCVVVKDATGRAWKGKICKGK
jgi:hypothetical protein